MNERMISTNFDDMTDITKHKYIEIIGSLLTKDSRTDKEIGRLVDVSREMVYKWRTKQVSKIRTSNLSKLAEVLDHELIIDDDGLIELTPLTGEDVQMANAIESTKLFDTLSKTTDCLLNDNKDLKEEIKELRLENKDLKVHIIQLERDVINKPNMNLDNNRMQFIVNMETQSYTSCTQKYADLFQKDAFDIIKNAKWSYLVHKDDHWRFPIIQLQSQEEQESISVWKIAGKVKNVYIETSTLRLDEEGILKKIDAKMSTKKHWEESNEWYRTYNDDYSKKNLH